MTVARAIGALPASLALLAASGGTVGLIVAFTLLMGAWEGVITIVRGAVPLALFGVAAGYGAVPGALLRPWSSSAPPGRRSLRSSWSTGVGAPGRPR